MKTSRRLWAAEGLGCLGLGVLVISCLSYAVIGAGCGICGRMLHQSTIEPQVMFATVPVIALA
jgi:hypothetical protein